MNNVLCLIFFRLYKSPYFNDAPKIEYFFNSPQAKTEKNTQRYESLTLPIIKSLFSSDMYDPVISTRPQDYILQCAKIIEKRFACMSFSADR
jgi:hypothetical protein